METDRKRRLLRRTALGLTVLLAAFVLALSACVVHLKRDRRDYMVRRHGTLVEARVAPATEPWPGVEAREVLLRSDSGLEVQLRLARSAPDPDRPRPLLLVVGGLRTGRTAVDLIGNPGEAVVAAIDYPYRGPKEPRGFFEALVHLPGIQRGLLDTPPGLSLALDWLLEQPFVDPGHVELCGVSLGVPFAATAGALDRRFSRVWLVHGGGEIRSWMAHNLRRQVSSDRLRPYAAGILILLAYDRTFEPTRWAPEIAPRPLILISPREDERLPRANVVALYEAAREPVELIWTETSHISPGREDIIQELRGHVVSRMFEEFEKRDSIERR